MSPVKLRAIAIGGLGLGLASAIPPLSLLNCACCALVIGGGILSSYLLMRNSPPSVEAPYGDAAVVGLFAGMLGAVVKALVEIPFTFLASSMGLFQGLEEAFREAGLPEELQGLAAGISGAGFSLVAFFLGLFINLFVYAVFATVGGLLGVAIFHRPAPAGAVSPPETIPTTSGAEAAEAPAAPPPPSTGGGDGPE